MAKNKNNTINSFEGFFVNNENGNQELITSEPINQNSEPTKKASVPTKKKKRINLNIDNDLCEQIQYLAWLERKNFTGKLIDLMSEYAELNKDKLADGAYKTFTD